MANQRLGEKAWNESPKALVVLSTACIIVNMCSCIADSQFGIVGVLRQTRVELLTLEKCLCQHRRRRDHVYHAFRRDPSKFIVSRVPPLKSSDCIVPVGTAIAAVTKLDRVTGGDALPHPVNETLWWVIQRKLCL